MKSKYMKTKEIDKSINDSQFQYRRFQYSFSNNRQNKLYKVRKDIEGLNSMNH